MADKHPYASGNKAIHDTINQLRSSLPNSIDAQTLKKLNIAPNNEGYILNILRFLGFIDENGDKTEAAEKVFYQHDDANFQSEFSKYVKGAYKDLFETYGDQAWSLDQNGLISYFRAADKTSQIVGTRQANTFAVLSAFSGKREMPTKKTSRASSKSSKTAAKGSSKQGSKKTRAQSSEATPASSEHIMEPKPRAAKDVGLTVRIEVNLPSGADQETYDRIFRSIRENLIDER